MAPSVANENVKSVVNVEEFETKGKEAKSKYNCHKYRHRVHVIKLFFVLPTREENKLERLSTINIFVIF